MRDEFFTKKRCDRCKGSLAEGRILSMFSEETICLKCKEAETKDPDYKKAVEADHEQIRQGNYNFVGIRGGDKNG